MATPRDPARLLLPLLLLCAPRPACGDGSDFDLADALDEPDPTTKPSGGLYPRLPQDPPPAPHGGGGAIYPPPPRIRPQPPPQPRPPHVDDYVGGGGHGSGDSGGQGPPLASIVSPVVSVVVLALLGAGVGLCKGRGCRAPAESAPV